MVLNSPKARAPSLPHLPILMRFPPPNYLWRAAFKPARRFFHGNANLSIPVFPGRFSGPPFAYPIPPLFAPISAMVSGAFFFPSPSPLSPAASAIEVRHRTPPLAAPSASLRALVGGWCFLNPSASRMGNPRIWAYYTFCGPLLGPGFPLVLGNPGSEKRPQKLCPNGSAGQTGLSVHSVVAREWKKRDGAEGPLESESCSLAISSPFSFLAAFRTLVFWCVCVVFFFF